MLYGFWNLFWSYISQKCDFSLIENDIQNPPRRRIRIRWQGASTTDMENYATHTLNTTHSSIANGHKKSDKFFLNKIKFWIFFEQKNIFFFLIFVDFWGRKIRFFGFLGPKFGIFRFWAQNLKNRKISKKNEKISTKKKKKKKIPRKILSFQYPLKKKSQNFSCDYHPSWRQRARKFSKQVP